MIHEHKSLREYNTFGIDVSAKYFAAFTSTEELTELLSRFPDEEIMILGGGSNVLFTKNFEGVILKNEITGIEQVREDDDFVYLKVGAGEVWHDFVKHCVACNLGGVENLSLIPGSVGASPMQNIGAYGVEIKDVFVELEAFHISDRAIHTFDFHTCAFGYRESVFKRGLRGQYIITSVTYRLSKRPLINSSYGAIESELASMGITSPTIRDISDAVIAIRTSKLPDPRLIGNAGSFFKNPVVEPAIFRKIREAFPDVPYYPADESKVKLAAGWLIEQAGWKGKTFGTYGVHKNQALVLVNYGGAGGHEIYRLSGEIIADIKAKFGIELEREVNVV